MKNNVLLYIIFFLGAVVAQAQTIILLYKSVPNSIQGADEEVIRGKNISKVSIPTITAYIPAADKTTGVAVIICRGGGYTMLAAGHEGEDVAVELNKAGIAAFVLKYCLPNDKIMSDKKKGPLQDLQQAFKI